MPNPRHVTLAAGVVSTLTLDEDFDHIEVVNVNGAAAIYFTVNGAAPSVKGDGCMVLPAAIGGLELNPLGSGATTVRLISAGTPDVSVRGWNGRA